MHALNTVHRTIRTFGPVLTGIAIVAAGCTSAASPMPSPTNLAPPSAAPAASPALASSSPSAAPRPSASPTAAPSATPLPAVGQASSDPWTSLRWVQAGSLPLGDSAEVHVFGWSRGFLALEQTGGADDAGNPTPVHIRASASSDGVTWSPPTALETGFSGMFNIQSIVEGPDGLLALAYPYGDTCGGPEPVYAMWSSRDGTAWQRLPVPKAFMTGRVDTIAGGPAGFIAFGTKSDGSTSAIWTSRSGVSWASRPLPAVTSGTLALEGVESFHGGFLVIGAVLGEGGCGGPAHIHPAIWSSADGASWARSSLPGASTDANTSLSVRRFGDQLLAVQWLSDTDPARAWTSTDGRTWTRVADVSPDVAWTGGADGLHDLRFIEADSGSGPATVITTRPDGTTVTVTQDGAVPTQTEDGPRTEYAVGPTGVLAYASDGSGSWIGIPK